MKKKLLSILLFFNIALPFMVILLPKWVNIDSADSTDLFVDCPRSSSSPPSSGYWNITDITILEDTELIINGSIILKSGGVLVLRNSSIYMNLTYDGQYWIDVEDGGNFTIIENSLITAYNNSNNYYIRVFNGSKFFLNNSEISYAGYDWNDKRGLWIETQNVTITNSQIHDNFMGIYMEFTNNISIINNTIFNNYESIYVESSNNVTIINNSISSSNEGVRMRFSNNVTMTNNTFTKCGLAIFGENKDQFNHTISNNVVNDRPLQYIFNQTDVIIKDGGQTIVAYSREIKIENMNLSVASFGAMTFYSYNISLINNTISNNSGGVYIDHSNVTMINCSISNSIHYGVDIEYSNVSLIENNISDNNLDGVHIRYSSISMIKNNISNNNGEGIFIRHYNITMINNTISNNIDRGIYMESSDDVSIINNTIFNNNGVGFFMSISNNFIMINNTFINDGLDIAQIVKDNFNHTVTDNVVNGKPLQYIFDQTNITIEDAGQIFVLYSKNVTIQNVNLSNINIGADIICSNNVSIINSTISNNIYYGIDIYDSVNVSIVNSTISNNNYRGIRPTLSEDIAIIDNTISNSEVGVYIAYSNNVTIINNIFNNCGLYISGGNMNEYNHTIKDNLVNNKPLQYIFDQTNVIIEDAGQIFVFYSQDVIIKNVNLSFASYGVMILFSNNISLINNTISYNNQNGVFISVSINIIMIDNIISNQDKQGINIINSNVSITKNTIINNQIGVAIWNSNGIIQKNNLYNNYFGIDMQGCNDVVFLLNNFINNTYQAYDYTANKFDNGVFGNYWDDYTGTDSDGDGIGDTPYYVDADSIDDYPLIYPYESNPPETIEVKQFPLNPTDIDDVIISANITEESIISQIILSYYNGIAWNNETMVFNSLSNFHEAQIPVLPFRMDVQYKIYTKDIYNNSGVSQIYSYIVASSDTQPPEIHSVKHTPSTPNDQQYVLVKVNVTDESTIMQVILNYYNGSAWNNENMVFNSTNNFYEAQIPALPFMTEVQYKVYAEDIYNNLVVSQINSYIVAASETQPPEIHNVAHTPLTPNNHQQVLVVANITDDSNISQVILSYYDGTTWNNVTMIFNSTNKLYEAQIPAISFGIQVQYKIFAVDEYGNWVESSIYTYTVVASGDDILLISIITISIIGSGVSVVGVIIFFLLRRRKRYSSVVSSTIHSEI